MVEKAAVEGGFDKRMITHVTASLYEALTNAVEHGNKGDERRRVTVMARKVDDGVEISVKDEGDGFMAGFVPDPTKGDALFKPRGRGIHIMKGLMDSVKYNAKGNEVTLKLSNRDAGRTRGGESLPESEAHFSAPACH